MNNFIDQVFSRKEFFDGADEFFSPRFHTEKEFKLGVRNGNDVDVTINELQICEFNIPLDAPIYMEGYQMLSQTAGTMGNPKDIGRLNEVRDYRLYHEDTTAHYGSNYFITKVKGKWYLIGATSCFRTSLIFKLEGDVCKVYWDLEGSVIAANSEYSNDYICFLSAKKRSDLMEEYAYLINTHHPHATIMPKTGWCSWYAYYADVTQEHIIENLDIMAKDFPQLEYLQIDDGYQLHMGDWLTDSDRFANGLKDLCDKIRAKGKKPAIWVAPFIADGKSEVFKTHPEWFIQGPDGKPLKAEDVTYGGWRETPWYLLDMSIPAVRERITSIFKTFHTQFGIDYFKLDACYWGAIKGLKYHNAGITAIIHYRLGLDCIRKGVGFNSYILGCNAPFWPSLGLVNGQRITDDVDRTPERITQQFNEFRHRNWMANRLWSNDIDCVVTKALPNQQEITPNYYRMLYAMALASGGPVLLGDRLSDVGELLANKKYLTVLNNFNNKNPCYFVDDDLTFARSPISGLTAVFAPNAERSLADMRGEEGVFTGKVIDENDVLPKDDVEIFIDDKF